MKHTGKELFLFLCAKFENSITRQNKYAMFPVSYMGLEVNREVRLEVVNIRLLLQTVKPEQLPPPGDECKQKRESMNWTLGHSNILNSDKEEPANLMKN